MKTFSVDDDNPSDIKKLISKLQKRRKEILRAKGYNEIKLQGSKYNVDNVLPTIEEMVGDTSPDGGNFYVYAHLSPLNVIDVHKDVRDLWLFNRFGIVNKPIYVGKGANGRWKEFNRDGAHRKIRSQCLKENKELIPVKLFENLSEERALDIEGRLIDILGCKHLSEHGYLTNLDEGLDSLRRRSTYSAMGKKLLTKNGFR
ncbi:MAG: hypothetical protein ACKO0Z_07385 [Betaproteobacteria bacterium]